MQAVEAELVRLFASDPPPRGFDLDDAAPPQDSLLHDPPPQPTPGEIRLRYPPVQRDAYIEQVETIYEVGPGEAKPTKATLSAATPPRGTAARA